MRPEVFIIESLRQEDHQNDRLEGGLIAKILELGGRDPIYKLVERRDQFIEALEQFATSQYRYLHLSCHGGADSFEFHFGRMTFEQFADLVYDKLENRRAFISACKAVNNRLANILIPRCKCYSLIGPYEPIRFDDAAILWASYYHLVFKNDQPIMDRKLILKTLNNLTKLYGVKLNYYSISQKQGIKLSTYPKNH